MEVQKIGEGPPPQVRWNVAQKAERVAEENLEAQLRTRGVPLASSPAQPTDKTYSPAAYAQAAQYALYTQSGVLAAMLGQSVVTPPTPISNDARDAIKSVDASASGTRLDLNL